MLTYSVCVRLSSLALVGLTMAPLAALADTITYNAKLSGQSLVPPNTTTGSGSITATYDTDSKKLEWKGSYTGLTGRPIMMHFHGPADATKTAPIVLNIPKFESPLEGAATLTDAQAADLMAGLWYVVVHTQSYPGGEIRGQVVKSK